MKKDVQKICFGSKIQHSSVGEKASSWSTNVDAIIICE